jgi:hypothetical protein
MADTDTLYKRSEGTAIMDCAELNASGALRVDSLATITGAAYVTGGLLANGTVLQTNGTAPTLPAGIVAFFGSGGANHAIVLPTAIGHQGRILFILEAGSGTTTATGYGTQYIGDNGTQAYTPTKYGLYISSGAHWVTMLESV